MILVFFFIILLIITMAIFTSNINIIIENLDLETKSKKQNKKGIKIRIVTGPKGIRLFTFEINSKNFKKIKIDKKQLKISNNIKQKIYKHLKKANFKVEKLDAKITLGTEDCVLTAYLIGITATLIANILPYVSNNKMNREDYNYSIEPVFNRNYAKINLNCIISVKLVHIICIIFLIKKGSREYERTSYRESYEYSYE